MLTSQRCERDDVVPPYISQWAEQQLIAVPGKTHIAGLAWQCRAGDVADRATKSGSAGSLENNGREAKAEKGSRALPTFTLSA